MAKSVKFQIDRTAARLDVLVGSQKLQNVTYSAMEALLPTIEAQFFQQFGVEGSFVVDEFATDRYTVAIKANSAQAAAVLKQHPGWLAQFTDNIQI